MASYTYKKGDTFGQVLINMGLSDGKHLWGEDGDVAYYNKQLKKQGITGSIPVGTTIHLTKRGEEEKQEEKKPSETEKAEAASREKQKKMHEESVKKNRPNTFTRDAIKAIRRNRDKEKAVKKKADAKKSFYSYVRKQRGRNGPVKNENGMKFGGDLRK